MPDSRSGSKKRNNATPTLIRKKPRLVCAPDAAFSLSVGPHSKTYFLEVDRGTTGINQIAHSKTPGYAAMAAAGLEVPSGSAPTGGSKHKHTSKQQQQQRQQLNRMYAGGFTGCFRPILIYFECINRNSSSSNIAGKASKAISSTINNVSRSRMYTKGPCSSIF